MLIVKHTQRFKGKLSTVNMNTELKPRKIKVKDHYHWYLLSFHQVLSLLVTPHTMQYRQSIRRSLWLALMCQGGNQKKKPPYTSIQLGILILLC